MTLLSQPRVYEWYKCLQEGREDIEDDVMSDRPSNQSMIKTWKMFKILCLLIAESPLERLLRK